MTRVSVQAIKASVDWPLKQIHHLEWHMNKDGKVISKTALPQNLHMDAVCYSWVIGFADGYTHQVAAYTEKVALGIARQKHTWHLKRMAKRV